MLPLHTGKLQRTLLRQRLLCVGLLILTSATVACSTVNARQEVGVDPSVEELIGQLTSDSYETRQSATRALVQIGAPAIPFLVAAVNRPDPESRMRVVDVLAQLAVCDQEEARELAQREISILAESEFPDVARLAKQCVTDLGTHLQAAALQRLSSLGAITSVAEYDGDFANAKSVSVIIGPEWKGTRADLNSIRWIRELTNVTLVGTQIDDALIRILVENDKITHLVIKRAAITNASIKPLVQLPNLQNLQLVYCDINDDCYDELALIKRRTDTLQRSLIEIRLYGTKFSREAAERLAIETGITIDRRNGAFLGVYFAQGNEPCVITRVVGNSAAAQAGIEVGDTFIKFAGRDITIADDFKGAVSNFDPGDEIVAVILRDGKELLLTIVLGEFQDVEQ